MDTGRITLAPGQRMDLIIDLTADPGGHRSLIKLVIGEYAYEIASFEFGHTARREQLLETPIALSTKPAQQHSVAGII